MKFIRRLFDSIQVWLYLSGNTTLASLVGRWGTPARPVPQLPESERPTLPEIEVEVRSGPGWSLDELPAESLQILDFDATFNKNRGIDVEKDIALPHTKLDVN